VQEGTLEAGTDLWTKDTQEVVTAKSLQDNGESISKAEQGKEIAVAFPGAVVGKQLVEGDTLYTNLSDNQFKKYKELKNYLKDSEVQILKEIVQLRRETNPLWGI